MVMKITLSELRKIIHDVLVEEADVPGRWRASSVEPADGDDLDRLGHRGELGSEDEKEPKLDEYEAITSRSGLWH